MFMYKNKIIRYEVERRCGNSIKKKNDKQIAFIQNALARSICLSVMIIYHNAWFFFLVECICVISIKFIQFFLRTK